MPNINNLDISTSLFEKKISDYLTEGQLFSEEDCSLNEKHLSGDLTLKNNKIVRLSEGLQRSVKVEAGDDLSKLFVCQSSAAMQLKKLSLFRTVECLILDGQQTPYWARLTLKGNKLLIKDIDIEKRFALDTEDQIEELERLARKSESQTFSAHLQ